MDDIFCCEKLAQLSWYYNPFRPLETQSTQLWLISASLSLCPNIITLSNPNHSWGGEPNKSHIHKLRWQPPWAIGIAQNLLEPLAQYKATGVNRDFQRRQSYLEQLQHANGRDIDSWGNYYFLSPHPFPFCSLAKWVFLQMLEALESDENYGIFYGCRYKKEKNFQLAHHHAFTVGIVFNPIIISLDLGFFLELMKQVVWPNDLSMWSK